MSFYGSEGVKIKANECLIASKFDSQMQFLVDSWQIGNLLTLKKRVTSLENSTSKFGCNATFTQKLDWSKSNLLSQKIYLV